LYPGEPTSRNYKTKEFAVYEFLKNDPQISQFDLVHDKRIFGGCSARRPDILLDFGFRVVIVEIDEAQHADYDTTCEISRLNQISIDVGYRQVVFIRFNPDDYRRADNTKVTSCWAPDSAGVLIVKKSKIEEWKQRLAKLREIVLKYSSVVANGCDRVHEDSSMVVCEYLFFNEK